MTDKNKSVIEFEINALPILNEKLENTHKYNTEEIDKQIQKILDTYDGKCELHIKVKGFYF